MQIKRIAASVEKIIFALFVIPIIGEIKRDRREARTERAITRHQRHLFWEFIGIINVHDCYDINIQFF